MTTRISDVILRYKEELRKFPNGFLMDEGTYLYRIVLMPKGNSPPDEALMYLYIVYSDREQIMGHYRPSVFDDLTFKGVTLTRFNRKAFLKIETLKDV